MKIFPSATVVMFGLLLLSARSGALAADTSFPFVIPWDDASPTLVDVSFLNDGPAGSHGFIEVKNGHFVEAETGKRIRFFGVDLAARQAFPSHEDAAKVAARLAKYGVNLVRLHHMDNGWDQADSLIDLSLPDRQHLYAPNLDRLDYLIYELKQHGIYCNINLHVSRSLGPADGFPASISEESFDYDKRIDYFSPRIIQLQKNYARDLLTHVNPYTHTPYTQEPAVLNVELTNEDSLLGNPWSGLGSGLATLPDPFSTELRTQWNDWLAQRYASVAQIATAWTGNLSTNSPDLLKPTSQPTSWTLETDAATTATVQTGTRSLAGANLMDPTDDLANWVLEQDGGNVAAKMEADTGALKVDVQKVDGTNWHVQVEQKGIDVKDNTGYVLTFRARADAGRSIGASASLDQDDWHNLGLSQSVQLSPDWQTFQLPFTTHDTVPGHSRICFLVGGQVGTIWLSDVSLVERSPVSDDKAAPALKITVQRVDGIDWHIQLLQTGLDLKNGETYTLRFQARADHKCALPVYTGLDEPDWHHIGLSDRVQLTRDWQTFERTFDIQTGVAGHDRLSFVLGGATGSVWLADVTLQQGLAGPPVEPGQDPATHSIPIPASPIRQQQSDWLTFLADTEQNYATGFRNYLKNDLGLKSLMICSQESYGGLAGAYRERTMDFVDNHAYWQHPSFPHRPWDASDWYIGNTSMVPALGKNDTLTSLARERVLDRPYTISEYNHPAPNDYQSECVPLLASFGALQDWDAIYLFDYGNYGAGGINNRIDGYFGVGSNPAKWAFVPAAAMMFRAGLVQPAPSVQDVALPANPDFARVPQIASLFDAAKIPLSDAFSHRVGVTFTPFPTIASVARSEGDTHIQVSSEPAAKARYVVTAPACSVVVGFVAGQTITAGNSTFTFGDCPDGFASLTLTAQDLKPLALSSKLLLTVADRVENTGMVWNARHNSVGWHWGAGPSVADAVPITITLTVDGPRKVYALDDTGKPDILIPAEYQAGHLTFSIGKTSPSLWYAVVSE